MPGVSIRWPGGEGCIGFDIYADLGYNGRCPMTEINGSGASARRLRLGVNDDETDDRR